MLPEFLCAVAGHPTPFVFNIARDSCNCSEVPTIQDLLEDIAEYHELECGCDVVVGSHAWPATAPLSDASLDLPQTLGAALPLQTRLDSLGSPRIGQVSLVIEGEDSGPNEFLRLARIKRFKSFTRDGATVFRRTGSDAVILPSVPSYVSLCATPGSVFVDKSEVVHSLLAKFAPSFVHVMRRPRGFGKTTLLSMVDAFFDCYPNRAHFPFVFDEDIMRDIPFSSRGQLLVFTLDLADLRPFATAEAEADSLHGDVAFDLIAIQDSCRAFLDAAATRFYARYEEILREPAAAVMQLGFSPTFSDVLAWSQTQDYQLCFLIDNYTAPFVSCPDSLSGFAVSRTIFGALDNLVERNVVLYALLVGDDASDVSELSNLPEQWLDLTDDSEFSTAVGFKSCEVAALGEAISVDLPGALQSALPAEQRGSAALVYASADVLSLARQLLDTGIVSQPPHVAVWEIISPAEDEEPRDLIFKRNCELAFGQDFLSGDAEMAQDDPFHGHEPVEHWERDAEDVAEDDVDAMPDLSFGSSNDSPKGCPPTPPRPYEEFNLLDDASSPLLGYAKRHPKSTIL